MKRVRINFVTTFAILALAGCTQPNISKPSKAEVSNYNRAIADAAVIEKSEIKPLPVIPKQQKRVRVVTWTKYSQSFPVGKSVRLNWGETWVTLDGHVRSRCRSYSQEGIARRVQQLLGLPPESGKKRYFVVLEVAASSLFRPCANPSLQTKTCTAQFPKNVSRRHMTWYAGQSALSYKTEGGYPWTRLGYTYDWNHNANEVGPAEFVIVKGARAKVIGIQGTKAYCGY